jgi:hypothetical protein
LRFIGGFIGDHRRLSEESISPTMGRDFGKSKLVINRRSRSASPAKAEPDDGGHIYIA